VTDARYVVDEHVSKVIVFALRRVGVNVVTLAEVGRLGRDDAEQLAWAHANGAVVITHDEDYVAIAYARSGHRGVGYCHQDKYRGRPGDLIRRMVQLHAELSAEDWANRVVFL
jgi:hypothetical protein